MQYNREGTAIMARYELSKDDFARLDKALGILAYTSLVLLGGTEGYDIDHLRHRFANAHSAYLDEDGND